MASWAGSKEERAKEWWDAWWAADYSWRGLANKHLDDESYTLQDYWLSDSETGSRLTEADLRARGELSVHDGQEWHVAHLPPNSRNGTASWKAHLASAEWDKLEVLLAARLRAAALKDPPNEKASARCTNIDAAQFQGAVLRRAIGRTELDEEEWIGDGEEEPPEPERRILHAVATQSITLGNSSYLGDHWPSGMQFDRAFFCGPAFFFQASCDGPLQFDSAIFGAGASFLGVKVRGPTSFEGAVFGATSEGTRFDRTVFERAAVFRDTQFHAAASFNDAKFCEEAVFERSRFSRSASFDGSKFRGAANFVSTLFGGRASFDDAEFLSETERVNFRTAVLKDTAHFWRTKFPRKIACISKAFTNTRFEDAVDFYGSGTHWVSALEGAVFNRTVTVDRPSEAFVNREFLRHVLPETRAAAEIYLKGRIKEEEKARREAALPITRSEIRRWRKECEEWRLSELESGCRTLKVAMGKQRDEMMEQRYYRFQLMARRRQSMTTPFGERLFSGLYGAASDYGLSILRPLAWMAFMILVFATVFWAWAKASARVEFIAVSAWTWPEIGIDPHYWEALQYSLSRMLPFGAFGRDPEPGSWLALLLSGGGNESAALAVRAVASLESLFAVVLAFLFALAVRRRFQMS